MSEELPRRYTDGKDKEVDYEGQRMVETDRDLEGLHQYVQMRLRLAMQHSPDGALAESMEFQGFDDKSIVFMPAENDEGVTEYHADGYRSYAKGKRIMVLGNQVGSGTYRSIAQRVEEIISLLPRDALEFVNAYTSGIGNIPRVPSVRDENGVRAYADTPLAKNTMYSDSALQYRMTDYRDYGMKACTERAEVIRENILRAANDGRFEKFAVDVSPNNPWILRLHRYKRDWIRRFKAMFREADSIPGVSILARNSGIPSGYEHDEEENFIASFDEVLNDFSCHQIDELRSHLEMMREDFSSILLFIRELHAASDNRAEGQGEFMEHPDLHEKSRCEGVIVELHKRK